MRAQYFRRRNLNYKNKLLKSLFPKFSPTLLNHTPRNLSIDIHALTFQQNKDQMDEIQTKIRELKQLQKGMTGADGVDAQELEEIKAGLDSLDSRWTTLTDDIDSEDQR